MAINYGTIISGAARSDSINSAGLPIDMEANVIDAEPSERMLVTLSGKFETKGCDQREHKHRERRPIPNFTTVTLAQASGQSSITVKDYSYIKNDHVLVVIDKATGAVKESLLVQDTSIDASVSVVRAGSGTGTTQTAYVVGDIVLIGPEAHAEGEDVPTAYTNTSVSYSDYIMQIDRAVKMTDINANIAHYDQLEKTLAKDRKYAWLETLRDINLLMYIATASKETTSASVERYIMGGAESKITENILDLGGVSGGFTREALGKLLNKCNTLSSSGSKVGLFGTAAWDSISSWPVEALRISPKEKAWGVRVNRIITGYGELDVAYDSVLNASRGLQDRGYIFDTAHCKKLFLKGLPMRLIANIQNTRDVHNIEDAITGTVGFQLSIDELHAKVSGVK